MFPAVHSHRPAVSVAEEGRQGNVKEALGVSAPCTCWSLLCGVDRHCPDNPVQVCIPRYSANSFFHRVTTVLPRTKPGWGLPAHGLQHSNSWVYLCLAPTTPLGASCLCFKCTASPTAPLLCSRGNIATHFELHAVPQHPQKLSKTYKSPTDPGKDARVQRELGRSRASSAATHTVAASPASSSQVPLPRDWCSVLTQTHWSQQSSRLGQLH